MSAVDWNELTFAKPVSPQIRLVYVAQEDMGKLIMTASLFIAPLDLHEDNTTAITAMASGKNPTMKTLERQHGVIIAWIHNELLDGRYNVVHTSTDHMTADLFTKTFTDAVLWGRLRKFVNFHLHDLGHYLRSF